ncbi:MAG: B12-binding domain-containing radical SAM protein [Candidatus Pacearchaeota archaeon]|nr:B12-binding domain-containing radical SAM protein [Candidatus Pacearchaeota archaeon]
MRYLLVNVPETEDLFGEAKISVAVPMLPPMSLASLGAVLLQENKKVKVLDLRLSKSPIKELSSVIKSFLPDYVGLTFTTPLFEEAKKISNHIKELNPKIKIIVGGPHVSALKNKSFDGTSFDIAVFGEGEITLQEICRKKSLSKIKGIIYKSKNKIKTNPPRELIKNLDDLPFPAWELFDLTKYKTPRISCKANPVGPIETSRGCVYGCVYCSKCTFGRNFRVKSSERVIKEIKHMLKSGFKEIHVLDDMFSTDMDRAKDICNKIISNKLKFTWSLINGIRIDRVDEELLIKLKKSGCYRLAFGVETGDQKILTDIQKQTTIQGIKRAFKLANKVGIETIAFCMFALPGETPDSMQKTIDLMKEVKPTLPKVSILLPLPGTPLFEEWDKQGHILTKDWQDYSFHSKNRVYKHPTLSDKEIYIYYKKFWKELLLTPSFLFRRLLRDMRENELFYDIYYFSKTIKFGW